ncbi:hypothetical protein Tsubulata_028176 [Turnera subulata]|uniref:DUF4283 domain-containing protein n=1 Tax=Turnera subulata TaxID=218843 RepID=A0A9Q0J1L5_9ROSI|nr:hypothetical protein Tsubulata_028176 [Turnera subulata]
MSETLAAGEAAATEVDRPTKKVRNRERDAQIPMVADGSSGVTPEQALGGDGVEVSMEEVREQVQGDGGRVSVAGQEAPTTKVSGNGQETLMAAVSVNGQEGPTKPSFRDILTEAHQEEHLPDSGAGDEDEVEVSRGDISFVQGKYGRAVRLSEAFKERLEKRWDYAVVMKLLGRYIGYRTLCSRLQTLWKPSRPMKVVDLENDFYLVRLQCEEDYYHALADGPWVIMGHALSLQPWNSSFRPSEGQVSQAVIWARFAEFPPSWYNSQVLHALDSLVGGVMKVDDNTKAALRGKFARVAVEVDLVKPLRGVVEFDDMEFKVSYEGLPVICYNCGSLSHSLAACPRRTPATTDGPSGSRGQQPPSGAGDWMNVPQRGRRRGRQGVVSPVARPEGSGSRFNVFNSPTFLATEEEDVVAPKSPVRVQAVSVGKVKSIQVVPVPSQDVDSVVVTVGQASGANLALHEHAPLSPLPAQDGAPVVSEVPLQAMDTDAPLVSQVSPIRVAHRGPGVSHTAISIPPQMSQQVLAPSSQGPLITPEFFSMPPPVPSPSYSLRSSRVPSSPTKPPDLNLISRFGKQVDGEKKKQVAVLPLKKPPLKISSPKKMSMASKEGSSHVRKSKGSRSLGPVGSS